MTALERRYRRLVRICYPAGYRREWGTEMVDTYLTLSGPAKRWPSLADVTDIVRGGIRRRVREAGGTAPGSGVPLAATLALVIVSALAGGWTVLELNPWTTVWTGYEQDGAVVSLGVAVWAVWLLAAVAHLVTPGRRTRMVIGLALVVTVVVVPVTAALEITRPPLYVLLFHACLGFVALGVPARPPVWQRPLPLLGAAAALPPALTMARDGGALLEFHYGWPAGQVLPAAGMALLVVTVFLAVVPAGRDDFRGAWALLVLIGPIGVSLLRPLAEELAVVLYGGGPNADRPALAAAAAVVASVTVIAWSAALILQRRSAAGIVGSRS